MRNALRSSMVQLPPLLLIASEKAKPASDALGRLTMPHRLGPTRLGPPLVKVWQAAHFFAACSPFSTDAEASSFSIGSAGAAASGFAPCAGSPVTATS